jgi:hypothetical protein
MLQSCFVLSYSCMLLILLTSLVMLLRAASKSQASTVRDSRTQPAAAPIVKKKKAVKQEFKKGPMIVKTLKAVEQQAAGWCEHQPAAGCSCPAGDVTVSVRLHIGTPCTRALVECLADVHAAMLDVLMSHSQPCCRTPAQVPAPPSSETTC